MEEIYLLPIIIWGEMETHFQLDEVVPDYCQGTPSKFYKCIKKAIYIGYFRKSDQYVVSLCFNKGRIGEDHRTLIRFTGIKMHDL